MAQYVAGRRIRLPDGRTVDPGTAIPQSEIDRMPRLLKALATGSIKLAKPTPVLPPAHSSAVPGLATPKKKPARKKSSKKASKPAGD